MFLDCLAMARQGFSATLYGCSTLSCFLEEFGVLLQAQHMARLGLGQGSGLSSPG